MLSLGTGCDKIIYTSYQEVCRSSNIYHLIIAQLLETHMGICCVNLYNRRKGWCMTASLINEIMSSYMWRSVALNILSFPSSLSIINDHRLGTVAVFLYPVTLFLPHLNHHTVTTYTRFKSSPPDKMAAISQTIFSDAFWGIKIFVFWLNFTDVYF